MNFVYNMFMQLIFVFYFQTIYKYLDIISNISQNIKVKKKNRRDLTFIDKFKLYISFFPKENSQQEQFEQNKNISSKKRK